MTALLSSFLAGAALGGGVLWVLFWIKTKGFEKLANKILDKADLEAQKREAAAKKKAQEHQKALEKHQEAIKEKIEKELFKAAVHTKALTQQKAEHKHLNDTLQLKVKELKKKMNALETQEQILVQEKEHLAKLTSEQGKELLLATLKEELKQESAKQIQDTLQELKATCQQRAAQVIATAINRTAVATVSELTTTTVALKNEEIKGRIIGREGRNIRSLEQATGVNLLIDDTPKAVVISGFDPIRKQVAKRALQELVHDGRIHPTRIEEAVARAQEEIEQERDAMGEEAALTCGVHGLHPTLITHLGTLGFKMSYSQNVLKHSMEVSYLLGFIAEELRLDVTKAKRIGLLHDIGKGADKQKRGSHALIGQELALVCGEDPVVANGIGCHHGEVAPTSILGSLCSAADALSASRPGARIEAVENYVRRLKDLEVLSKSFKGVEKAYALQAGKEVRVMVTPDLFDDASMTNLARAIAKHIEDKLSYPGKIKVTVIRETKAIEYAL